MKRRIKRKDNEDRLFDFIKCRQMKSEKTVTKRETCFNDTPLTGSTSHEDLIKQEFIKEEEMDKEVDILSQQMAENIPVKHSHDEYPIGDTIRNLSYSFEQSAKDE